MGVSVKNMKERSRKKIYKVNLGALMFAVGFLISLTAVGGGFCSQTTGREPFKIVAVAEGCSSNGYVIARRTNFNALSAGGYVPVMIPNVADTNIVATLMNKADALLITGAVQDEDYPNRLKFEFMLLDMALERGIPVLGFCHGHQAINRYFGGKIAKIPADLVPKTVHRGKESPYVKDCFHEMIIEPGTRLAKAFGSTRATINTSHRYHITRLGKGLKVTAKSPDGVIEAIEHETLPVTGYQFHPERLHALDPAYMRIIRDGLEHPAARPVKSR